MLVLEQKYKEGCSLIEVALLLVVQAMVLCSVQYAANQLYIHAGAKIQGGVFTD